MSAFIHCRRADAEKAGDVVLALLALVASQPPNLSKPRLPIQPQNFGMNETAEQELRPKQHKNTHSLSFPAVGSLGQRAVNIFNMCRKPHTANPAHKRSAFS